MDQMFRLDIVYVNHTMRIVCWFIKEHDLKVHGIYEHLLICNIMFAHMKSLFSKPLTSTPTCYSFADQVTAKKQIFNTKFTAKGKC